MKEDPSRVMVENLLNESQFRLTAKIQGASIDQ
jgi:hypothetical protein